MRDFIISEIKRIAAENGNPPGKRTFERTTGISEGKWSGRIWARWGDALNEAGFAANVLNSRLDEGEMLASLADACRHLGKWPTQPELMLYRSQVDPSFPDEKTFRKRFPVKAKLAHALRQWCSQRGASDVIAMLPSPTSDASPSAKLSTTGYIYLISMGEYYKIGRGEDLERRVKQIVVALPGRAALIHAIETDDLSGIEAYWHSRFAEKRANGEWFKLNGADVAAFRRRKFQ